MVLECLGYGVYSEACKQEVALFWIGFLVVIFAIGVWYIYSKYSIKEGV